MNKNTTTTELTKEQKEAIKALKIEKKLLPKGYKEWKTDIKSGINKLKLSEWYRLILSLLFEVTLIPLNCVMAFIYAQFQNHDYARKYKKITGKYPSGYMIPELMLVVCFAVLGALLVDYKTDSSLQKHNQELVETLDSYSEEDGIHIDPFGIFLNRIGYDEYRKLSDSGYINQKNSGDSNVVTEYVRDVDTPEVTSSPIKYDNIVTVVDDQEATTEYGFGEGLREVVG